MHAPERKRVVIVTGASRGLGRSIAISFGRSGDRVIVNFVSHEGQAIEVVNEINRSGGEALAKKADVRIRPDVEDLCRTAMDRWGSVDVLVNNAGITKDHLMLRMHEQDWDEVLDTNLKGVFLGTQAVARIMERQRSGHIINISSIAGVRGREGQANYAASKAGVIGLTKTAARELGSFNIKVNAVLPGYLPTDMGHSVVGGFVERVRRENALGRGSDSEEVAAFVHHISGMSNVSGQVFNLDSRIV